MANAILASATPFIALCALACPVGMGAMMWFMARGSRSNAPPAQPPATLDDPRQVRARQEVSALVSEFGEVALVHFAKEIDKLDPARVRQLRRLARGA